MDEKKKAEEAAAAKVAADAAAATAKAEADAKALAEAGAPAAEIAAKEAEIRKLTEDRDNYRAVALKRLGKLPGDGKLLDGEGSKEIASMIEEQVRAALIDRELDRTVKERDDKITALAKENSELRLAMNNRPGNGLGGGGSGAGVDVKDNVFSETQITEMTKRAQRLKMDPVTYIAKAKSVILSRR